MSAQHSEISEPGSIIIDEAGDLMINIMERVESVYDPATRHKVPQPSKKVCEMKVIRATLVQSSDYFKNLLDGNFKEAKQNIVEIHEDPVTSMELWFKGLHNTLQPDEKLDLSTEDVGDVLTVARKYLWKIEVLQTWFSTWFKAQKETHDQKTKKEERQLKKIYDLDWLKELAYLCYMFDHAEGFAFATMNLAYDAEGPVYLRGNSIPDRISYQINAVRGTMSNRIDKEIFLPLYEMQNLECDCKEAATFAYVKALKQAKAFNGRSVFDTKKHPRSVHEQAMNVDQIEYKAPANACEYCNQDFKSNLADLRNTIMNYFDGLCLDCITGSNEGRGGADVYWSQMMLTNSYGDHCRIGHDEPTWYFSYMGRQDDRDTFKEAYLRRQRGWLFGSGRTSYSNSSRR